MCFANDRSCSTTSCCPSLDRFYWRENSAEAWVEILFIKQNDLMDDKNRQPSPQRCVFSSFLSVGFITAILVNPPERKLAKRTSVAVSQKYSHTKQNIPRLLKLCSELWLSSVKTFLIMKPNSLGFQRWFDFNVDLKVRKYCNSFQASLIHTYKWFFDFCRP